jgi:hypothetical protein
MSMAAVFPGIQQASNTKWHSGVLYKFSESQLATCLIKLIATFLTDSVTMRIFYAKKISGSGASSFRSF